MDPITAAATAFAAAQTAVATIKKAQALGKDISNIIGEFGKFFDAKDVVQKAANDLGKKGQSDTSKALEIVMHAEQLRQAEEELKHLLIYGYGQAGLWEQLLLERSKIRQAKEREARELERKRKKIAKQRVDWAIGIAVMLAVGTALTSILIMIVSVVNSRGNAWIG
jgi:hypothetical protein